MKKRLKNRLQPKSSWLSPWYILVLALIFGVISIFALRQNNLTMIKYRNQVFAADKANGNVESALRDLRHYVYSHMNTNLKTGTSVSPPIQLKYTYERLLAANKAKTKEKVNQIYDDAQKYCVARYAYSAPGNPRFKCVENYVKSHGGNQSTIPDGLYKFDFASPTWTPDLAGVTLVVSLVLLLIFAVRFGLDVWLKHDLQDQI